MLPRDNKHVALGYLAVAVQVATFAVKTSANIAGRYSIVQNTHAGSCASHPSKQFLLHVGRSPHSSAGLPRSGVGVEFVEEYTHASPNVATASSY